MKIWFSLTVVIVVLTSCSAEPWTNETRDRLRENCEKGQRLFFEVSESEAICDCAVKRIVAQFPDANYSIDQQVDIIRKCSEGFKYMIQKEIENAEGDSILNDSAGKQP